MRITTAVTRLLSIDLPILAGGTAQAALAVSTAGGLGVIEAGHMDLDELATAMEEVQAGTTQPFAVSIPLDATSERLGTLLAKSVRVVVTSGAGTSRVWSGPTWLHMVETLEEALAADGMDGLVVGAGETGAAASVPFGLLRDVAPARPNVPLIATGGTDLAGALALGAGAVWFREPLEGSVVSTMRRVVDEYESTVGRLSLPATTPSPRASVRAAREAAALRENLLRRKKQARARLEQP